MVATKQFFDLSSLTAIFPGGPKLAGTRMSPLWILLEIGMMEVVSGDNWSYKTCKVPVRSSPPTNQQPVFTGRMCFLSPNQQCQSAEGTLLPCVMCRMFRCLRRRSANYQCSLGEGQWHQQLPQVFFSVKRRLFLRASVIIQYWFGAGVSWEGFHRSGILLAMPHRHGGLSTFGLGGLETVRWVPPPCSIGVQQTCGNPVSTL